MPLESTSHPPERDQSRHVAASLRDASASLGETRPRARPAFARLFRFRLRTLFVLVAFCAVLVGWWRDRSQLQEKLLRAELLRRMTLPDDRERIMCEVRLLWNLEDLEGRDPLIGVQSTTELVNARISIVNDVEADRELRTGCAIRLAVPGDADVSAVERGVTALIDALDDNVVRKQATLSLGHLGSRGRRAVEPLLARLQQPNAVAAAQCAWALWRIDRTLDLSPRIEQLLKHDDAEVRRWAAYAVAFSEYVRAVPLLIEMLRDPDAQVRVVAAYGVMNLASKEQALLALAGAAATETEPWVRSSLVMELQLLQIGRGWRLPDQITAESAGIGPPRPPRAPSPPPPTPPSPPSAPGLSGGPPPAPTREPPLL